MVNHLANEHEAETHKLRAINQQTREMVTQLFEQIGPIE